MISGDQILDESSLIEQETPRIIDQPQTIPRNRKQDLNVIMADDVEKDEPPVAKKQKVEVAQAVPSRSTRNSTNKVSAQDNLEVETSEEPSQSEEVSSQEVSQDNGEEVAEEGDPEEKSDTEAAPTRRGRGRPRLNSTVTNNAKSSEDEAASPTRKSSRIAKK